MRLRIGVPAVVLITACGGEAKPNAESAPPAAAAPAPVTPAATADSTKPKPGTGNLPAAARAADGMLRDSAIKPIGAVDDKGKVTPIKKPE